MSSHTLEQLQEKFRHRVEKAFVELRSKLRNHSDDHERLREASKIHLVQARQFYESIGNTDELVSHLTCLVCLDGVPEHSLPCGHVICRACAEAAGESTPGGIVTLQGCPLQDHRKDYWLRGWVGYIKPSQAGLRILSLDGYGFSKASRGEY